MKSPISSFPAPGAAPASRARRRAAAIACLAILVLGGPVAGAAAGAQEPAPSVAPAPAAPEVPAPAASDPKAAPLVVLHTCPGDAEGSAPLAPGVAQAIRERVKRQVGGEVTSVCRTSFGLYEVIVDAEIIYVDERVRYLLAGNVFDLRTQTNLTARRKEEALRVDFKALPFDLAVKTVRGNGSRVVAIFEDPNCPYCKRFEQDIATLNDTTIYTFLYPILSRDAEAVDDSYPKSRAIWCAPDRAAAWSQTMLQGRRLAPAAKDCKHPLEEILALGQKLHITGTPTLLFTDGRRAPGAIPLAQVEQMMAGGAAPAAPAVPVSR